MADKIRYTVKDYLGNPTSVPVDRVEAFLARQEELKAMVARGEKPELDAVSKAKIRKSVALMREWASQPLESHGVDLEEWLEKHSKG